MQINNDKSTFNFLILGLISKIRGRNSNVIGYYLSLYIEENYYRNKKII